MIKQFGFTNEISSQISKYGTLVEVKKSIYPNHDQIGITLERYMENRLPVLDEIIIFESLSYRIISVADCQIRAMTRLLVITAVLEKPNCKQED